MLRLSYSSYRFRTCALLQGSLCQLRLSGWRERGPHGWEPFVGGSGIAAFPVGIVAGNSVDLLNSDTGENDIDSDGLENSSADEIETDGDGVKDAEDDDNDGIADTDDDGHHHEGLHDGAGDLVPDPAEPRS